MTPSIQKKKANKRAILTFLRYLVLDKFPVFTVVNDDEKIFISGTLEDDDWKNSYNFLITSNLTSPPTTYISKPDIRPGLNIHMYDNKSLCLYHPSDLPNKYNFCFIGDIIPWLIKWVHFYEIWLRNGNIWKGPEAPH